MKYENAILDLDGVISNTSELHKNAWIDATNLYEKTYNVKRQKLFNQHDYEELVNGKSRKEGIIKIAQHRAWSPRRNIQTFMEETKNQIFLESLEKTNTNELAFDDTHSFLKLLLKQGLRIACCSSSKNARKIIEKLRIENYFELIVDGNDIEENQLKSKPSAEPYLYVVETLKLRLSKTFIVEDSKAGLLAGYYAQPALLAYVNRTTFSLMNDEDIINLPKINQQVFTEVSSLTELEGFLGNESR